MNTSKANVNAFSNKTHVSNDILEVFINERKNQLDLIRPVIVSKINAETALTALTAQTAQKKLVLYALLIKSFELSEIDFEESIQNCYHYLDNNSVININIITELFDKFQDSNTFLAGLLIYISEKNEPVDACPLPQKGSGNNKIVPSNINSNILCQMFPLKHHRLTREILKDADAIKDLFQLINSPLPNSKIPNSQNLNIDTLKQKNLKDLKDLEKECFANFNTNFQTYLGSLNNCIANIIQHSGESKVISLNTNNVFILSLIDLDKFTFWEKIGLFFIFKKPLNYIYSAYNSITNIDSIKNINSFDYLKPSLYFYIFNDEKTRSKKLAEFTCDLSAFASYINTKIFDTKIKPVKEKLSEINELIIKKTNEIIAKNMPDKDICDLIMDLKSITIDDLDFPTIIEFFDNYYSDDDDDDDDIIPMYFNNSKFKLLNINDKITNIKTKITCILKELISKTELQKNIISRALATKFHNKSIIINKFDDELEELKDHIMKNYKPSAAINNGILNMILDNDILPTDKPIDKPIDESIYDRSVRVIQGFLDKYKKKISNQKIKYAFHGAAQFTSAGDFTTLTYLSTTTDIYTAIDYATKDVSKGYIYIQVFRRYTVY